MQFPLAPFVGGASLRDIHSYANTLCPFMQDVHGLYNAQPSKMLNGTWHDTSDNPKPARLPLPLLSQLIRARRMLGDRTR